MKIDHLLYVVLCVYSPALAWGQAVKTAPELESLADDVAERQLTSADTNHVLTNVAVWSHDGEWIVYDLRSDRDGTVFDGRRIERVNVNSGHVEVLYEATDGAGVGVVTTSPRDNRAVFIHGPEHPTPDWQYAAYHRRGLIVDGETGSSETLDARNLVAPFTPGALRGGSHVHVFSGDGRWISFTYEDHVLAVSNDSSAQKNQRGVGVSVPLGPVQVPPSHPRNHDGSHYSVLVTRTWDAPTPGSDQINRAYDDAWVGVNGYRRSDGQWQTRALAFIGDCLDDDGNTIAELFVVDIPDDVNTPDNEPLCGTETTRPAPPRGTVQRRLTRTSDRKYPGLFGVRQWPRSSPDGEQIAFLMRDDHGVSQLWSISPTGQDERQLTRSLTPIQSAFTFRGDGRMIACVIDECVCEVDARTGQITRLTQPHADNANPILPHACVYSPDGTQIAYLRSIPTANGPRNHIFVCHSTLHPGKP